LRSTAANATVPAVGASLWASGSQPWKGTRGTLIAKASAKAAKSQSWLRHHSAPSPEAPPRGISVSSRPSPSPPGSVTRSKLGTPPCSRFSWWTTRRATNMRTEPSRVKRKNFVAAWTRRGPPHTTMTKYINTSISSQKT
jgi:hypothetical protein